MWRLQDLSLVRSFVLALILLVLQTGSGAVRLPLLLHGMSSRMPARVEGRPPGARAEAPAAVRAEAPPRDLVYSTFLGSRPDDAVRAIAIGPDGSAYVTGTTGSPDFPTTPGAFDRTYNSHAPGFAGDAFVARIDRTGKELVWSTFLGGFDTDNGMALALGADGSVYVAGYTYSDDFPTTPGAWRPTFAGGCCDAFVVKLDPTGSRLLYGTFLGGSSFEAAWDLAVDADGRAHVTGETLSEDFPTTPGAFDTTYDSPGYSEAYVLALSPHGSRLFYSTFLGGIYNDYGFAVALGSDGSVHVAGETQSRDFPTAAGAYDRSFNGGNSDAFVAKLDPLGQRLAYGTFLGGRDSDGASAMFVDPGGRIHVAGETVSEDFPITAFAFQGRCVSCSSFFSEAFATGIDTSTRTLAYSTYLGGSESDYAGGIAPGPGRSAYVVGTTFSRNFPMPTDAPDGRLGGVADAFVVRVDSSGHKLEYGRYLGGSGTPGGFSYDFGAAAASGGSFVWVVGTTGSDDFPTTQGTIDRSHGGQDDGFVTKLIGARPPPRPVPPPASPPAPLPPPPPPHP